MWNLGLLGAATTPPATGSFDLLETVVLSGTASTIEVTNLVSKYSSNYAHLQLRFVGKTNRSDFEDVVAVRINNSTTRSAYLQGSGGAPQAGNEGSPYYRMGYIAGGNSGSTEIGSMIIDIFDAFDTTNVKSLQGRSGWLNGLSPNLKATFGASLTNTTNAIDSLGLVSIGSYVINSRLSLYGLKVA